MIVSKNWHIINQISKIAMTKAKCSYGIQNSNPVTREKFTFRSNNKTQGNVKLFLVTRFKFVHAITALYIIITNICQPSFMKDVDQLLTLCSK